MRVVTSWLWQWVWFRWCVVCWVSRGWWGHAWLSRETPLLLGLQALFLESGDYAAAADCVRQMGWRSSR